MEELQEFPDRESPEFKAFAQQQLLNDEKHKPSARSLKTFPRTQQLELAAEALRFCVDRGPKGTGTYPTAFTTLAALVNEYGVNDALEVCYRAGGASRTGTSQSKPKLLRTTALIETTPKESPSFACLIKRNTTAGFALAHGQGIERANTYSRGTGARACN